MGLFDKKDHVKNTKELKGFLKNVKSLSPKEKKALKELARPNVMQPSGLSKKEWNKVLQKADKENIIDHSDAYRLKKYGR